MSDQPQHATPEDPEGLRGEIEQTRADLARTVDAITEKVDVKARAKRRATEVTNEAKVRAATAGIQLKSAAPAPVQQALDKAGAKTAPAARKVAEQAGPHRNQILAGAGAALVLLLVIRRRGHGRSSRPARDSR